ncbi:MAG TPA: MATE family efflux transporter [Oscillospiraceae bacterium]|nr:MATE family efflux transporter [Oscillospiraceae bacterium]HPK34963.1 MATE family efflux transporter [Oscillospiraceae bacterium]HPR75328.1 MATE family efflux transporter [Oscillospiraceae bacterium]
MNLTAGSAEFEAEMRQRLIRNSGLMTEGPIAKQLLIYAIPILLSSFLQQLYNIVDTMVAGKLINYNALAAVGANGVIVSLLVGFFLGFTTGGSVIISQAFGARDTKGVFDGVHTAVGVSIAAGVLLTGLGLVFTPALLKLINTPEEVRGMAIQYLTIYFCGTVPVMLYNMGSAILRAVGNSTLPLVFLAVAAGMNTVLDFVFVGGLKMGIAGTAWATVISQTLAAALTVAALMRTEGIYKLFIRKIRIKKDVLFQILKLGVPAGLQTSVISLSNILIQRAINGFGAVVMAGAAVAGKVDGIVGGTIASFGLATTGFSGQNYGAGRIDRVKKGARIGFLMSFSACIIMSGILLIFRNQVASLFNEDPQVIKSAVQMMVMMLPLYWVYGIVDIFGGTMRGAGSTFVPMVVILVGMCLMRMVWIAVAAPVFSDVRAVFAVYPISWIWTAIPMWLIYLRGKWNKKGEGVISCETSSS